MCYNIGCSLESMKLAERIKKARKHAELTQAELIQRIKDIYGEKNAPTQQTLSKLETGNQDGTEFAVKIAKACGVSPYWIDAEIGEMTGESGSALKSRDSKSPQSYIQRPPIDVDRFEEYLAKVLRAAVEKKNRGEMESLTQGKIVSLMRLAMNLYNDELGAHEHGATSNRKTRRKGT